MEEDKESGNHKVIFIIGAIIIIAVVLVFFLFIRPGVKKSKQESNLNLCFNNIKRISAQLDNYHNNRGEYPKKLGELAPDYFKSLPTCPEAGKDTYSGRYEVSPDGQAFTIFCGGKYHAEMKIPPDFPAYYSTEGIVRKK
ncbi:MAG: hypothetical protein K8T10_18255 [Candidatus Eremiobacteraeota bacterium]|nr:hypothetical protein [Candidatus Eremiobacteraeota bacterium]